MDQQKIDMFLMTYSKYFESYHLPAIRDQLIKLDDSKYMQLHAANLKDPTIMLIVSLIGGHFGIDRFLLGETGLGIAETADVRRSRRLDGRRLVSHHGTNS